jgi:adenylyltransferase/sulfurtransferase
MANPNSKTKWPLILAAVAIGVGTIGFLWQSPMAPWSQVSQIWLRTEATVDGAPSQITVEQLQQYLNDPTTAPEFVLVDVRTPAEYAAAHIPGAISIPLATLQTEAGLAEIQALSTEHQLITYCARGPRSHRALGYLARSGISGTNLTGGFEAWQQQTRTSP